MWFPLHFFFKFGPCSPVIYLSCLMVSSYDGAAINSIFFFIMKNFSKQIHVEPLSKPVGQPHAKKFDVLTKVNMN